MQKVGDHGPGAHVPHHGDGPVRHEHEQENDLEHGHEVSEEAEREALPQPVGEQGKLRMRGIAAVRRPVVEEVDVEDALDVQPAPYAQHDRRGDGHRDLWQVFELADVLAAHLHAEDVERQKTDGAADAHEMPHVRAERADKQRHDHGDGKDVFDLLEPLRHELPEHHAHEVPVGEGRGEQVRCAGAVA